MYKFYVIKADEYLSEFILKLIVLFLGECSTVQQFMSLLELVNTLTMNLIFFPGDLDNAPAYVGLRSALDVDF